MGGLGIDPVFISFIAGKDGRMVMLYIFDVEGVKKIQNFLHLMIILQFGEAGGEVGDLDLDVVQVLFGTGLAAVADDRC